MCTNDLMGLHYLLNIYLFLVRKIPVYRDSNSRNNVPECYEVTSELPGRPPYIISAVEVNEGFEKDNPALDSMIHLGTF